jgi:hypothetical protein
MEKDTNMRDKEFDDLFSSKLDNFEVEPAAQVWQNIDAALDGKKKKGTLSALLAIAASVIILIGAALLLMPKKETSYSGQHKNEKLAHNQAQPAKVKPEKNTPRITLQPKAEQLADAKVPAKPAERAHRAKKIETPAAPSKADNQLIAKKEAEKRQAVKADEQPLLAAAPGEHNEVNNTGRQPEQGLVIKESADVAIPAIDSQQPVLASVQPPAFKENKTVAKRRGIHNFGDLVNLVVAKVDKRSDKLVVFSNTDDDESTITAFHLGAIKIKRDN